MSVVAFPARFDSLCRICDSAIKQGDMIRAVGSYAGASEYAHDECAYDIQNGSDPIAWTTRIDEPAPEALELVRPACPRCFLELPASGVCGSC